MLDTIITIVCIIVGLSCYIYLKATGELWYGIRWDNIFYDIRRSVCRLLLKLFK